MKKHFMSYFAVFLAVVPLITVIPANAQNQTLISPDGVEVMSFTVNVSKSAKTGDTAIVNFVLKNSTVNSIAFDANGIFVGCRQAANNRDFGHAYKKHLLPSKNTIKFQAAIILDTIGTWEFWPAYHMAGHYGPYRWMVKAIAILPAAPASTPDTLGYQVIKNPAADSPYYTLIQSLRLISAGDFDKFIRDYSSPTELSYNNNAIQSLKRYPLPALQRIAPNCLKEDGKAIHVTKIEGNIISDNELKIFIAGAAGSMPKSFKLIKENGTWKIASL